MIKFLFVVFMITVVFPSVLGMVWSHYLEKKAAKDAGSKKHRPPLSHAQMMALLEPDGKPVKKAVAQPVIIKQTPYECRRTQII